MTCVVSVSIVCFPVLLQVGRSSTLLFIDLDRASKVFRCGKDVFWYMFRCYLFINNNWICNLSRDRSLGVAWVGHCQGNLFISGNSESNVYCWCECWWFVVYSVNSSDTVVNEKKLSILSVRVHQTFSTVFLRYCLSCCLWCIKVVESRHEFRLLVEECRDRCWNQWQMSFWLWTSTAQSCYQQDWWSA